VIQFAYGVRDFQLLDGPDWIKPDWFKKDRYDISAKAELDAPADQIRLMLQSLLEDRFRLVVRTGHREMPIHEVVLDRATGVWVPA
jgi:uncharacterized protein (TIGR03435 family)